MYCRLATLILASGAVLGCRSDAQQEKPAQAHYQVVSRIVGSPIYSPPSIHTVSGEDYAGSYTVLIENPHVELISYAGQEAPSTHTRAGLEEKIRRSTCVQVLGDGLGADQIASLESGISALAAITANDAFSFQIDEKSTFGQCISVTRARVQKDYYR
jgi:hypothetical protein